MGRQGLNPDPPLHVFFFPFMASGHLIPISDMARLFSVRGCRSTLISTPANEPVLSRSIQTTRKSGHEIDVVIVNLPLQEVGLSPEHGDLKNLPKNDLDARDKFFRAVRLLERQLEGLLEEHRPDCLVSDMFLPWTTDVAAKFGIPRIVFHGTGNFPLAAGECVRLYEPHKKVSSDTEPFLIPELPGEITLTRSKLPDFIREETPFTKFFNEVKESERRSFGVVVNSFYELEPVYVDYYRNGLGRRTWQIGPLLLCNKGEEDKTFRGDQASIDCEKCLSWLDSREPSSVVYVCFGSMASFNPAQLQEIAVGLESSGQNFIWVVKKDPDVEEGKEEWLPEGYEERMGGRGLIIRGWAPQVLILEHVAVGAFVTHCGWNSTLEGISCGVAMVTWPVAAEQFYNEKLVTEVLKVGVPVGVKQWIRGTGDWISEESVEKAVRRVMEGEEGEGLRRRAKGLSEMARRAVEEGGSSYADFYRLMDDLRGAKRHIS
ncbi:hypothetical protein MLD38_032116 [Melastoma candidum]|uniref:Uncharacterized protein n=1 Tax=Melastoma candidum TaxID=119954 RepID=A0ACB9M6V4_9MYRT|nr:hypothetical protein MLD38_032116 [Melastoma candidum]